MVESEPQSGQAHPQAFTVHIGQGVLAVGPKPLGDVIFVPGKDADGFADGNQLQAQLHLAAEPDMVSHHAIPGRVGATFPNLTAEEEGAALDGHVPVGIDGPGNGDLVEEVEEIQVLIEHDGGAENGIDPGLCQLFQGVG